MQKEDISFILAHPEAHPADQLGEYYQRDLLTPYAADMVTKIRHGMQTEEEQPLAGMKIIVDAGNGAGGFAEQVLVPLGQIRMVHSFWSQMDTSLTTFLIRIIKKRWLVLWKPFYENKQTWESSLTPMSIDPLW